MAATHTQAWQPEQLLTPWVVFDLERVAWTVEQRAPDLTPEQTRIVRDACHRMLAATATAPGRS